MFLKSLVTTLSERQREHSYDIDEIHHFRVMEEELGFDIQLESDGRGQVFFHIPFSYFTDIDRHNSRYLLCQSWRIAELDPDTPTGRYDLQITSDLEEITIDRHIQNFTHRDYNMDVNMRIHNNMYNIYIHRDETQENDYPRRPRHRRRRRKPEQ